MIDREMVISCTTSMGAALSGLSVIPLCLIVGKRTGSAWYPCGVTQ